MKINEQQTRVPDSVQQGKGGHGAISVHFSMHRNTKLLSVIRKYFFLLIGLFILCAIVTIGTDKFLTYGNIMNILRQVSINMIIAVGMTFVILIGGIDLSVGAVVAISGVVTYKLIVSGLNVWLAFVCGILAGALCGLFSSELITRFQFLPFIATLAVMQVVRGSAYAITGSQPIRAEANALSVIGNGFIGKIPVSVIIMFVIYFACWILLNKTKFGRYVYAIGGNRETAVYSGVNAKRVERTVYLLSGILSALAGIVLASKMYSGQPTIGDGYELDAIASVVLGGTSLNGGIGTLFGTMIGALIIGVLNNGLNLLKIPFYYQFLIKGLVIIFAVLLDVYNKKSRVK